MSDLDRITRRAALRAFRKDQPLFVFLEFLGWIVAAILLMALIGAWIK